MANPRTIARIAARVQERAAHCLQFELRDPRASFITITRVEVSSDLSVARVYYSVLGDAGDRSKAEHLLDHARGFVQRQVARVLHMRRAPQLRFQYDDSLETAAHIDALIREARERDRRIDPTLAEREAAEAALAPARAPAGEPHDDLGDEPEEDVEPGEFDELGELDASGEPAEEDGGEPEPSGPGGR
jgi:ribosome-binding factor A